MIINMNTDNGISSTIDIKVSEMSYLGNGVGNNQKWIRLAESDHHKAVDIALSEEELDTLIKVFRDETQKEKVEE